MVELFALAFIVGIGMIAFPAAAQGSEKKPMSGKMPYPNWTQYDALFQKYAQLYGVPDWRVLKAFAIQESDLGNNPRVLAGALSYDGKSKGLMQFTLPTAQRFGGQQLTLDSLNNAELSIELAGKFVGYLWKRYNGDLRKVVISYNQGEGNTDKGRLNEKYWTEWSEAYKLAVGGS